MWWGFSAGPCPHPAAASTLQRIDCFRWHHCPSECNRACSRFWRSKSCRWLSLSWALPYWSIDTPDMSDSQFCLQGSLLIGSGPLLNSLFSAAPTLVSLVSSVPSQSDHCTSCSATLPCFAQTWLASVGVHWAHGYNPRRRSRWFHIKLHPLASTSIRWSVSQWKHSIGRLCIAFLLLFSPLKRLSVLSV